MFWYHADKWIWHIKHEITYNPLQISAPLVIAAEPDSYIQAYAKEIKIPTLFRP